MTQQPTFEELEYRVKQLEKTCLQQKNKIETLNFNQIELAQVLSNVPLFMMTVDQDRRVKKISTSLLQFAGKTEEEALGLRGGEVLGCIYHSEDQKGCGFANACDDCVVKQTVEDTLSFSNAHKKVESTLSIIGDIYKERTLSISTVPIEYPDKQAIVFIEDITKKKIADEQLKKNDLLLKQLGDNLPKGSAYRLVHDVNGKRYFDYAGSGFKHLFGLDPDELKKDAAPLYDLTHPDDWERVIEAEKKAAKALEPFHYEGRLVFPNGKTGWYQWHSVSSRKSDGSLLWEGFCMDITEQKQTEERLSLALQGANDGLWDFKPLTGEIYYSPQWKGMLGYEDDELDNNIATWENLLAPDDKNKAVKTLNEYLNGKTEYYHSEFRMRHKNGTYRHILTRAFSRIDADGKIIRLIGTHVDITKLKTTQGKLKKQSAEFLAIFNSVIDTIVFTDTNRKIRMINPAFTSMFGYTLSDVCGKHTKILYSNPEDYDEQGRKRFNLSAKDKKLPYEVNYRRRNGEVFTSETVGSIVRDETGQILGYLGIIRDITERKKAEAALRQSEERLSLAAESGDLGMWEWQLDTGDLIVTDKWLEITGLSRQEYLTRYSPLTIEKFMKFVHPDDQAQMQSATQAYFNGETDRLDGAYRFENPNKGWIWLSVTGQVIDRNELGEPTRMVGFQQDISDKKEAEITLMQNQVRLQKYANTQAILLQEVNHRVKNNLTTLISMLHIEEDRGINNGNTGNLTPLKILKNRVTGLLTVHSLLSANMWEPLELYFLCREVISKSLQGISPPGGFNLKVEQSSYMVQSDMAHHLALILNELATNTAKHGIGNNGSIDIKVTFEEATKDTVCLIYADKGSGFPEMVLHGEISKHSIGVEMTNSIVQSNIRGQIRRFNNSGAVTEICFPVKNESIIKPME